MGVLASEEEAAPVGDARNDNSAQYNAQEGEVVVEASGRYIAVFDPLDGSSNVDANIPTGTIFVASTRKPSRATRR